MPPWQSATYSSDGDRTLATYIYDAETVDDRKNDLDKLDYGNGDSVEYEYDDKGRVTKQTYEDGDTVTYTYDNDGALAKVTDSATGITTTYYYDLTGRLMKYTEGNTTVSYTYDTLNNLTYLSVTVNGEWRGTYYTYDSDNRVTRTYTGRGARTYGYNNFGCLRYKGTEYDGVNMLTYRYTYTAPSSTATSSQIATYSIVSSGFNKTFTYAYDNNGNITSISDGTNTTTYVYDSANQLIRENNQADGYTHTWEYDNAGNILNRKEYAYTTGTLGTPSDTITYTYGDSLWGDLLTAYDGNTITYDAIGNPLTDGTWTYTWEHGRELASISDGTTTWTYTYDADGMRIGKTDGTTNYSYVYIGGQLRQVNAGSDKVQFAYDAEGTPLTVKYNGDYYFYVTNVQGDVIALVDPDGATVVQYTYDAWGKLLSTTGTLANTLGAINPLRYRGYVYDNETGLYYLQSRYYNPEMGRFINADAFIATGQGFVGNNMFAYCLNNPVLYADPSGDIVMESTILTAAAVVVLSLAASYCLAKALLLCVEWAGKKISDLHNPFPSAQEASQAEIFTQTPDTLMISETFPNDPVGKTVINEVSTKGRERMRDSGLAHETDEEVQQKAHDRSLPSSVRQRYKREEKARGLRNVQKRSLKYSVPIGGGFHLVLP